MFPNTVSLPLASSSEHLEALAEVSHFGVTNMGFPGAESWTYRILKGPLLTEELERKSSAQSCGLVDLISFQPCPSYIFSSQDRYVTEKWDILGGTWTLNGVFDGHLNHHTVDFVSQTLPLYIKESLQKALACDANLSSARVSNILSSSILRVDEIITSRILDLFPQPQDDIGGVDTQRDFYSRPGESGYKDLAQSMGGATLILSLTDSKKNLWVANLGDCRAVLGYQQKEEWSGFQINSLHDASNPSEVHRIYAAHPNEDPIKDSRVLGFLEPTRAVGDTWLKLPGSYASHIYSYIKQPWISSERLRKYASRILTPPYVSNNPDVYHRVLPDTPCFVMLSSDGLFSTDLYYGMDLEKTVDRCNVVSRNLTVEMEERWMDDITIVVQTIYPEAKLC